MERGLLREKLIFIAAALFGCLHKNRLNIKRHQRFRVIADMIVIHFRYRKGIFTVVHSKFHDFFYRTFQNGTQYANGVGGNILVVFQAIDLTGAEAIVLDKPVLSDVISILSIIGR